MNGFCLLICSCNLLYMSGLIGNWTLSSIFSLWFCLIISLESLYTPPAMHDLYRSRIQPSLDFFNLLFIQRSSS
jgi:hypothetical protein